MKLQNIDVNETITNVKTLLSKDKDLSPALRAAIEMMLLLCKILLDRLSLNSANSSKPPSSDPNRKRTSQKKNSNKKPGGQNGHAFAGLKKEENPDKIKTLKVDKKTLPPGRYEEVGYKTRQVIDIKISRVVTEYRAQILENKSGKKFIAPFPKDVTRAIQYGKGVKAHAVYMSQFQLIPYNRIQDHFRDQMRTALSTGSLCNFNKEAFELLEAFEGIAKTKLFHAMLLHVDETGININGKRKWLHTASNDLWTHYYPHEKRGSDAMNDIGIIPNFNGVLCHDHWKPYYKYDCLHALCNAHHLRELECAWEQDGQEWAKNMKELLTELNKVVDKAGGQLSPPDIETYQQKYRTILKHGDVESPPPKKPEGKAKRGRLKKTKSRNLLERLRKFEDDVLRFMKNKIVPFTNNQGENDLRMTKVQQKISGCFRSMDGALMFCRIRGYLSTCRKHEVAPTHALELLFSGKLPDFVYE